MAKLSIELWKALQQLKEDEFKKFKWFLKQDDVLEGRSGFAAAQLERADRQDTVDLMAQKYGGTGAIEETMKVFEKISRNDLVQNLQKSCLDPKDFRPQDCDRKRTELKSVQPFAVDVTLDPKLISSGDGKQAQYCDVRKKLLDDPERFFRCVCWSGQRIDRQEGTKHN